MPKIFQSGDGDRGGDRRRVLGPVLAFSPILGYLASAIYATSAPTQSGVSHWAVFGVAFVATSAALVVGALVGFLFGLPRVLEKASQDGFLATNTNLDEISDWLTKILVGLGLIQLGKLMHGGNELAESLGKELGAGNGAHAFALSLLIYSTVDAFLVGYLWTRIVVSIRLSEAAEQLAHTRKVADEVRSIPPPAQPTALPPPPSGGGAP